MFFQQWDAMDVKIFNKHLRAIRISENSFEEIYKFYYPRIIFHINNKFRLSNLSQDVAHEFFTKQLESEMYTYIESPTCWVYKVCDNIALNMIKREQRIILTDDLEKVIEMSGKYIDDFCIDNAMISVSLKQRLSNFDEDTQKIFYLYICEGYNLKDISFLIKVNYEAVKKKFARAIKKLEKVSPKSPF